jgi:hypothetical protein
MIIALLHPGAMGCAVGQSLREAGHAVRWCAQGRSAASLARANAAGLRAYTDLESCLAGAEAVVSVVPPEVAEAVAQTVAARGFQGAYLDLNAISPATAARVAALFPGRCYGDGGIVGLPPQGPAGATLLLTAPAASLLPDWGPRFSLQCLPADADPFAASALKCAFAAWSKGSSALLLSVETLARELGLLSALHTLWDERSPGLRARARATGEAVAPKAWRFAGEMEEIAQTFRAAGLPSGAFEAAAALYRDRAAARKAWEEGDRP